MTSLTINLTPEQYQLAINYQNSYNQLFDKQVSLEELFKLAMFFSLNANLIKIGVINSYSLEEDNNDDITKTNIVKNPFNKAIAKQTKEQTTLKGIAPLKRVNNKRGVETS